MPIKRSLALAIAALLLLVAAPAQAAITVVNTNDSGPGSLRQALIDAPPGETISLPAGSYSLTSGPLEVAKSVTIAGAGAADTTVRSAGAFRVVESTAAAVNLELSDLTVRDGVGGSGAGISAENSTLTLRGVTVTANRASGDNFSGGPGGIANGGGIFILNGTLNLTDSVVSDNRSSARGDSGQPGGIADGGGIFVIGSLSIVNSTISGNVSSAPGGSGPGKAPGGIADGGGVFLISTGKQPVTIDGSTISGNTAEPPAGPEGSTGIAEGGGIFVIATEAPVAVKNTTISSNVSRSATPGGIISGGGMYLIANAGADVLATTFSGNRTETPAGGGPGGNLFTSGTVRIGNSIVANGAGAAAGENCGGTPTLSLGFNLDSLNQCAFTAAGDQVNANPLLGPLQDNGGPTATMAPATGSPVIDKGGSFGLTTDQRGLLRPVDLPNVPNSSAPGADGADIGAVEVQPPPPPQQLSNAFKLGKVTKNRKKGRARIQVILLQPAPGTLTLTGKAVKKQTLPVKGETQVSLLIVGKKKVRKALLKKGKRKVKFNVTYTPTGTPAATKSRTVKLVKKKKTPATR